MKKKNGLNLTYKFFQIFTTIIIIISISTFSNSVFALSPSNTTTFTGEQIFRGVLFGEAPVAQLFPEIWGSQEVADQLSTKGGVKAWEDLKESVVSHIKTTDPNFLNRFGQEMQSGEHIRVKDALNEAREKNVLAMKSLGLMDANGEFLPSQYNGTMACSKIVVCVVAVAVAAWKWVAVVDVAAIAIAIWRWTAVKSPKRAGFSEDSSDSLLYYESLINDITLKLDESAS